MEEHELRSTSPKPVDSIYGSRARRRGTEEASSTRESDSVSEPSTVQAADSFDPEDQDDTAVPFPNMRILTAWDVAALIINKMVGTGIFTGPPSVLLYLGNREHAILVWVGGFIFILICMYIYLEYARKFPYTGGELIYLDAVMPGPPLLWYTIYSIYSVLLYTISTNSLTTSRQILLLATLDDRNSTAPASILEKTQTEYVTDQRVWRLVAFVALTFICLLVYFSPKQSRKLNLLFAFMKVTVLIVLFGGGAKRAAERNVLYSTRPGNEDLWKSGKDKYRSATAVLHVLFGFQGWENATLVSGEIKNHQTLRKGFIGGVLVVGTLYTLIALVYSCGIPWNEDGNLDTAYAFQFFGGGIDAERTWAVITTLSALGSMLSVTYTCARVKQVIAWANILPWSQFWRRSIPLHRQRGDAFILADSEMVGPDDLRDLIRMSPPESPEGGVVLHWLFSTVSIAYSAAIRDPEEANGFGGRLLSYGQACIGVVLALGYLKAAAIPPNRREIQLLDWDPAKEAYFLQRSFGRWALVFVGSIGGLALLILAVLPDESPRQVQGWWYLVIIALVVIGASTYWLFFLASGRYTVIRFANATLTHAEHGTANCKDARTCGLCNAPEFEGQPHRHVRYGYQKFARIEYEHKYWFGDLFHWIFGGSNKASYPLELLNGALRWLEFKATRRPAQTHAET